MVRGHFGGATRRSLVDGFGRVAVIGVEPLLEAKRGPGGRLQLLVYGQPGSVVLLETAATLSGSTSWSTWKVLAMDGTAQAEETPPITGSTVFIRARRQ